MVLLMKKNMENKKVLLPIAINLHTVTNIPKAFAQSQHCPYRSQRKLGNAFIF